MRSCGRKSRPGRGLRTERLVVSAGVWLRSPTAFPSRCSSLISRGAFCSGSDLARSSRHRDDDAALPNGIGGVRACDAEGSNEGIWWRVTAIFTGGNGARTLLPACCAVGLQGGLLGLLVWLPTFLKSSRGLSVVGTTNFSLVITVGSFFGFLAGAWLVDAIGRRKNFMAWSLICSVTMVIYLLLPVNNFGALLLGFPLGFVVSGIYGGIGAYLTELFPTQIRGTAQSFAYNFGRVGSALVPPAIGMLSSVVSLAEAIAIFSVACYSLVFVAVLFLPETKGIDLSTIDDQAQLTKGS